MAHFRRRRPRASGHAKMYSNTGWRARHNLRPVKVPDWREGLTFKGIRSLEYLRWREWRNRICYPADAPSQMANWPRWWDIMHHTRPTRRKNRQTLNRIMRGVADPDEAFWRDGRRPHIYYW